MGLGPADGGQERIDATAAVRRSEPEAKPERTDADLGAAREWVVLRPAEPVALGRNAAQGAAIPMRSSPPAQGPLLARKVPQQMGPSSPREPVRTTRTLLPPFLLPQPAGWSRNPFPTAGRVYRGGESCGTGTDVPLPLRRKDRPRSPFTFGESEGPGESRRGPRGRRRGGRGRTRPQPPAGGATPTRW